MLSELSFPSKINTHHYYWICIARWVAWTDIMGSVLLLVAFCPSVRTLHWWSSPKLFKMSKYLRILSKAITWPLLCNDCQIHQSGARDIGSHINQFRSVYCTLRLLIEEWVNKETRWWLWVLTFVTDYWHVFQVIAVTHFPATMSTFS